jgi:nitrite reductase (NO-forming)
MRKFTINSVAVIAATAVAALSLVQLASARPGPEAHTSATAINVSGKEFSFKLSSKSIGRPGTVTFNFKNAGHMLHDFKINGKKTPLIKPGKTAKLTVSFKKKGAYHYLCTVPGHAAAGMKGVFTVR